MWRLYNVAPYYISVCYIFIVLRDNGLYFLHLKTCMRYGASIVWHLSFSIMDSFNKTETSIDLTQAVLHSWILIEIYSIKLPVSIYEHTFASGTSNCVFDDPVRCINTCVSNYQTSLTVTLANGVNCNSIAIIMCGCISICPNGVDGKILIMEIADVYMVVCALQDIVSPYQLKPSKHCVMLLAFKNKAYGIILI